jgi:hypothetical protein
MSVFHTLNFSNPETILNKLDLEINNYHQGILSTRNICWSHFFSASYFQKLLQFLMMQGSPNYGLSKHPADYLLEAPAANINQSNLNLYTFEEYFQLYQNKLTIAIRRQWIGQNSNSEHKRALNISKKPDNQPWVFNNIVGTPRTGWRDDYEETMRKTVYFLMIEKKL